MRSINLYIEKHGGIGRAVLKSWNDVDPFKCYYGEETNPDEYLRYAKRFMKQFNSHIKAYTDFNKKDIVEMVRRSFYIRQITDESYELIDVLKFIKTIAEMIHDRLKLKETK